MPRCCQESEIAFGCGATAWAGRCGKLRSDPAYPRAFCPISKPAEATFPLRASPMSLRPSTSRWRRSCPRRTNENQSSRWSGYAAPENRRSEKPWPRHLGASFLELDALIEKQANLSLQELFSLHGEAYYKRLAYDVLLKLLPQKKPMVIATGGSVVTDPETWQLLKRRTHTVWVKATPEDHWKRVLGQGDTRPMANRTSAMAELRSILSQRSPALCRSRSNHRHQLDTRQRRRPRDLVRSAQERIVGAVYDRPSSTWNHGIMRGHRPRLQFPCILLQYAISLLQIEIANNYDAW